jgi:hypothetical protein
MAESENMNAIETTEADEFSERDWVKAAARSPSFEFLADPKEDIYTVHDGKPFDRQSLPVASHRPD